jgi:hypothetical protein
MQPVDGAALLDLGLNESLATADGLYLRGQ